MLAGTAPCTSRAADAATASARFQNVCNTRKPDSFKMDLSESGCRGVETIRLAVLSRLFTNTAQACLHRTPHASTLCDHLDTTCFTVPFTPSLLPYPGLPCRASPHGACMHNSLAGMLLWPAACPVIVLHVDGVSVQIRTIVPAATVQPRVHFSHSPPRPLHSSVNTCMTLGQHFTCFT